MEYVKNIKTFIGNFAHQFTSSTSSSGTVTPPNQSLRSTPISANGVEPVEKMDDKVNGSIRNGRRLSSLSALNINANDMLAIRRASIAGYNLGSNIVGSDFGVGSLRCTLFYEVFTSTLRIRLEDGKNLSSKDPSIDCNSYVTICIHPGNFLIKKSQTVQRTNNPKFNETIIFKNIDETILKNLTFSAKVHVITKQFGDRFIGEVDFPLSSLCKGQSVNNKRVIEFEKYIVPINNYEIFRGLLMISLCMKLKKNELVVYIIAGKDLKSMEKNKYSDPFCTLRLSTLNTTLDQKRTSVKYKSLTPFWNESFYFTVTSADVKSHLTLEVKVFDKGKDGQELIGELQFSLDGYPDESKHWQAMLDSPGEAFTEWHSLKFGN